MTSYFTVIRRFVDKTVKQKRFGFAVEASRLNHFMWTLMVSFPVCLFLILVNFPAQNYETIFVLVSFQLLMLLSLYTLTKIQKVEIVYHFVNLIYIGMLILVTVWGTSYQGQILWCFTYPVLSTYLFGNRSGIRLSLFVLLALLACITLFMDPSQSFPAEFLFRFGLVYVTLLCITFWLEYNRSQFIRKSERQSRAIQKKSQLLEDEKRTLQQEISRRLELEEELTALASTDSLTGLYNRRYFWTRTSEEIVRAARYNHQLSLAVIDIDNFKRINDLYGHPAGDEVIKCIAQYCSGSLRVTDIASRIGGEEFAVLLFHTPISDAVDVMDRLRSKISEHRYTLADDEVAVTVSIGISTLDKQNIDIDTLYTSADEALYCAKNSGKNCVKQFEKSSSI